MISALSRTVVIMIQLSSRIPGQTQGEWESCEPGFGNDSGIGQDFRDHDSNEQQDSHSDSE